MGVGATRQALPKGPGGRGAQGAAPGKPPSPGRGRRQLRGAGSGAAARPVRQRRRRRLLLARERYPERGERSAGRLPPLRCWGTAPLPAPNSQQLRGGRAGRVGGRESGRERPLSSLQPSRSPRREAAARPGPARAPPASAVPTWPPAPPPGGGSLSPSPPGGPAAHRVAIISFPVTKEAQILWSPHR